MPSDELSHQEDPRHDAMRLQSGQNCAIATLGRDITQPRSSADIGTKVIRLAMQT